MTGEINVIIFGDAIVILILFQLCLYIYIYISSAESTTLISLKFAITPINVVLAGKNITLEDGDVI